MPVTRWVRTLVRWCLVFALLIGGMPANAQNASVTVGVGDNILIVQGKTAPNAFVTISRDGGVIGTSTANSAGVFTQTFSAQEPGIHAISVQSQVASGTLTDTVTANINIAEHATTTADFFLPSTLAIANSAPEYGQALNLYGETCPSCTVTIYIDDTGYIFTTADAQGQWSVEIPTDALASGEHTLFAKVADEFGTQSYPTNARTFTIATPPTTPDITPPPGGTPTTPVITFPTPGTVWPSPAITVTGTADPLVQIELFDGPNSIGSVWSDENGNWSILITLESREYDLRVRACRDGVCSPLSELLKFLAQPPGEPLILEMPRTAFTVTQNDRLAMQATIKNGEPPFYATVVWGDDNTNAPTYHQRSITLEHTYAKPGRYTGWVEVADKNGRSNRVYFSASVLTAPIPPLTVLAFSLASISLIIVYPAFRFMRYRFNLHKKERNK